MNEVPIRRVSGEKLPSKHALVSAAMKIEARGQSGDSWQADGGGAEGILHQSRKEKGIAG